LFDAARSALGVDFWRDALRPDTFRTPWRAGRVKSAAFFTRRDRSHAQEIGAYFALPIFEHGEDPPFDATEHRGSRVSCARRLPDLTHRHAQFAVAAFRPCWRKPASAS